MSSATQTAATLDDLYRFEAGTAVVWDVDPVNNRILKYRVDAPDQPEVFGPGQEADAEPVVPGWKIAVDEIFA